MDTTRNKVILVTGASSGIGWATARELAARGAKLMLTARREDRLRSLQEEIESGGGVARYHVTDVVSKRQVEAAVAATEAILGPVDVLFNNAGIMPLSHMDKLHVNEWEEMVDVNIKGVLHGIAGVLPGMMARNRGHIINVSSVAGHVLFPGAAVYCGTKFAVRAITEGLRLDLHPKYNIRVTLISPGAVSTELAQSITDTDILDAWKASPVSPIEPEIIARSVAYAISEPDHVDVSEIVIRPVSQNL